MKAEKDMKAEFKKHVETIGDPESASVFSANFAHDNMETSWIAARAIFGDRATPEHAFEFYDRMHAIQRDIMSRHSHDEEDDDEDEGVDCNTCGCPEGAHVDGVGSCSHSHCDCKKFVSPRASC